jgi:two-component system chemotaxis response regulator CheY
VDDEPDIRKVVRLTLTKVSYDVLEAGDGEECIEIINSGDNPFLLDVVILDVRMPRINGLEVFRYIRREFPKKRIIIFTGYPDIQMATEFLRLGAIDYVVKPVESTKLIAAVKKAFDSENIPIDERSLRGAFKSSSNESPSGKSKAKDNDDDVDKLIHQAIAHSLRTELEHIKNSVSTIRALSAGNAPILCECENLEVSSQYARLNIDRLIYHHGLSSPKVMVSDVRGVLNHVKRLILPRMPANISLDVLMKFRDVDTVSVEVDELALVDILVGLITNAVEALGQDNGKVVIEAGEHAGQVLISVADNGPGISESIRDSILKKPVPSAKGGMGVGLFLSNKVLSAMGGLIHLGPSSIKGTSFTIILPKV